MGHNTPTVNIPWKYVNSVPEGFGAPPVPSLVSDSMGQKLYECASNELAQMVCALPDLAAVVVGFLNNPTDPHLKLKAQTALAKFDAIGPFAPIIPGGVS